MDKEIQCGEAKIVEVWFDARMPGECIECDDGDGCIEYQHDHLGIEGMGTKEEVDLANDVFFALLGDINHACLTDMDCPPGVKCINGECQEAPY